MKFGKRLAAEAARCWPEACLDYKAIKRALKHDLAAKDPAASTFLKQLLNELSKVSSFYVQQAELLEATLEQQVASSIPDCEQLSKLRAQIRQLIKFVALNYLAVVKAIKKRNRHCKVVFGADAAGPALHPLDLLRQEVFFTSPRLAALSTQAELLEAAATAATGSSAAAAAGSNAAAAGAPASASVEVEDYQCPICLDVLRSPVVLNCTHRFCWGCLVAHCAAITGPSSHSQTAAAAPGAAAAPSSSSSDCGMDGQQQHGTGCCSGRTCTKDAPGAPSSSSSGKGLVVLEKLVAAGSDGSNITGDSSSSSSVASTSCSDCYNCPVCRQPQVMNIDNLQVDQHLSQFVDELRLRLRSNSSSSSLSSAATSEQLPAPSSRSSSSTVSRSSSISRSTSVASEALQVEAEAAATEDEWSKYLLPRQLPCHAGRLTALLDLDGTLVSSFTPRRAPMLPPAMKTHLVGVGSSLNPSGVFVVERPGLGQFLQQLARVAEVVVFTAGLEEYASPIIDAIDPTGELIAERLYRPATMRTQHHQCVKDLAMIGRPLSRTVLVDDTPLAFLHQPENGVPVLGFRGDPDDRLLLEAVLPLLQTLAGSPDVRPILQRRFDMLNWFKRHGYPDSVWQKQQKPVPVSSKSTSPAAASAAQVVPQAADLQVEIADPVEHTLPSMLVFDFDKTVTEWDAGERLVSELAPELLPWLQGMESPANFVPITNEILAEMARRGVSRDRLLSQLQALGSELPGPMVQLLQWANQHQLPVKLLSDCNSVFISHILAGARVSGLVNEVITNTAAFERIAGAGGASIGLGASSTSSSSSRDSSDDSDSSSSSFKLVIQPRQPQSHNCPLCPSNLCKGVEMSQLLQQQRSIRSKARHASARKGRGRIVYAGDGANDICPALSLGPHDVVLAKAGAALARYVTAAKADSSMRQVAAAVYVWETPEELAQLVRQHAGSGKCSAA